MIFVSISNNGYFVLVPVQLIEYDVGYFELSSQSPPGDLLPQNREQLTQFPNIQRQMVRPFPRRFHSKACSSQIFCHHKTMYEIYLPINS
jgi:hypothetical protein